MLKKSTFLGLLLTLIYSAGNAQSKAISSAILNFGSDNCGDRTTVTFSLIGNPLGATPYIMAGCAINPPFENVFSKFIAYNPKDNKIYINDIKTSDSKIYIYDMGLPGDYTCPAVMPLTPSYNYLYEPNNFEFDINGDVWSIRDLRDSTAVIERIDEATGTILFSKRINFPSNNIPNTLGSGDIVLTPNGRMFIVMGDNPGRFYEITNYNNAVGAATANFIQPMPKPCYGILFLNGTIQLTGTNFGGSCYRYVYDLQTRVMSAELPFQLGRTPVDNSSISPATGITKRLIGGSLIDSTTANIVYEVYAKNMGNVKLDNFNVIDNLGAVYGINNVSNVNVSVIAGANPGNLTLNPLYDGITNTKLLNDNQVISNLQNGYIGLIISLKASHLIQNTIYNNTAFSTGEIGRPGSRIFVIDSSNNGPIAVMDINQDGDPGDYAENRPTPYFFGMILPIKFISINAIKTGNDLHTIKWSIAPPPTPVVKFEVEFSDDHTNWHVAGTVTGDPLKNDYYLNYKNFSSSNTFYRVRAYESAGKTYISAEALIRKAQDEQAIKVSPNPADDVINVYSPETDFSETRRIQVTDVAGKKVIDVPYTKQTVAINTAALTNGYYVVNVIDKGNTSSTQILVKHK
jgi:hypothetical protein